MCLIWGLTWIAIKIGVSEVPPVFFAAARFVIVSLILLAAVSDVRKTFKRDQICRTVASGLLINTATYALVFWGMQYVASGLSAVVNLALIPVGLFGLSVLSGDQQPSWPHAGALMIGIAGLCLLFFDRITVTGKSLELLGASAIVAGTLAYCAGTVIARPLLRSFSPIQLTAAHGLVGAVSLSTISLVFEPIGEKTFVALIQPKPLVGLLFLVFFGTFVAYSIYLRLVGEWGASKAGLYAFVSPIVALLVGAGLFGERLGMREIVGSIVMLGSARLALRSPAR
jgi:drug/metabolite transporter (DMT)-like permease